MILLVVLSVLTAQAPAAAEADAPAEPAIAPVAPAPTAPPSAVRQLAWTPAVDLSATAGFGALWLVSEVALKSSLAPATCHWCSVNGLDSALRGIRATTPEGLKTADSLSGVFGYVAAPVVSIGLDWLLGWNSGATWKDGAIDAVLILEAVMISQVLNQTVKFIAGRERPFVSDLSAELKPLTEKPEDNNLSFYSGHSNFAFALVGASATVAHLRGYRQWWVILAAGLPIAATTAVLRMVADKHYFSDVLTGATLGLLIGFGMPALFHRPVQVGPVSAWLAPGPGGVAVAGQW